MENGIESPLGSEKGIILKPLAWFHWNKRWSTSRTLELVEIRPAAIRMRKVLLKESDRKRKARQMVAM